MKKSKVHILSINLTYLFQEDTDHVSLKDSIYL